ncbi:MAG: hypothetical protein M9949_06120 [Candidatus Kapabacteria bacterium]|nr:hypothetical protein [Candidatus Kapabacteria bacterium]
MIFKASSTITHEHFQGSISKVYKYLNNHHNKEHFEVKLPDETLVDAIKFIENYDEIRLKFPSKPKI